MEYQPFSTPLLSWDIFLQGYHRRIALARDLQQLNEIAQDKAWIMDWDLEERLLRKENVVLVTNASQKIDFASSNILSMNGYLPSEVIGRTPRMFQGENTDPALTSIARKAIAAHEPFALSIVNYRKNRLPYHCRVEAFPVFNKRKELVNFIAFEQIEKRDY